MIQNVFQSDFSPESFEITDIDSNTKKYKHKDLDLFFIVKLDENSTVEFQIFDGDTVALGSGFQHIYNYDEWLKNFIYEKQFVVWLSQKKIQIF